MLYAIYDKDEDKVVEVYTSRRMARYVKKFLKEFNRNVEIIKIKRQYGNK